MVHLTKLAVGISSIAHLQQVQAARLALSALRHRTRHMPRRASEITAAGSIYWVICGTLLVRQRVLDIVWDQQDDGSRCASLMLDPVLVQVEGRPVKAFQGWRYLDENDAPPDLTQADDLPGALPAALRNELRALCLI